MSYITVDYLEVGYDKSVISEKLNFKIESGEYLCIVGENGSGKSTLMKTLLGLIKPVSGQIKKADGLENGEI